jgi:hypothetical protein
VAFVDPPEEIPSKVMTLRRDRPRARLRERVSHLTWDEMARQVVAGLEAAAGRTGS